MSELAQWALMLAAFATAGWAVTEALGYLKPDLTTWQRWAVVGWAFCAFSAFHVAVQVGSR